jgi:hypothetical protein
MFFCSTLSVSSCSRFFCTRVVEEEIRRSEATALDDSARETRCGATVDLRKGLAQERLPIGRTPPLAARALGLTIYLRGVGPPFGCRGHTARSVSHTTRVVIIAQARLNRATPYNTQGARQRGTERERWPQQRHLLACGGVCSTSAACGTFAAPQDDNAGQPTCVVAHTCGQGASRSTLWARRSSSPGAPTVDGCCAAQ